MSTKIRRIVEGAIDAAGQAGGLDEVSAIARKGPGEMTFSDDDMAALVEEYGTPADAMYAIQLEAQRRVSAIALDEAEMSLPPGTTRG
jgi:hypothetical protein